nr:MAG TPA: hypothetical protein [Caudoviricetes sp.]
MANLSIEVLREPTTVAPRGVNNSAMLRGERLKSE